MSVEAGRDRQRRSRLRDDDGDLGAQLDGAADGAQLVVGALHRLGQHVAGGVAGGAGREGDPERQLDVVELVAVVVADLAPGDGGGERRRFGASRRQDVDVDRRAAADGAEQQLDGREVVTVRRADRDPRAARVDQREATRPDPFDVDAAGFRLVTHASTLADAGRGPVQRSNNALTNSSGSNGTRSPIVSPMPTSLTGMPSSVSTANTMPPLADPSSFVSTTPVTW